MDQTEVISFIIVVIVVIVFAVFGKGGRRNGGLDDNPDDSSE